MKDFVKKIYGAIAKKKKSCCQPSCCSDKNPSVAEKIGYTKEELASIPDEANLGLGCGNPVALASLKEGETVVDLGSGAGIDVFLASKKVGESGKVIGVDMTEAMIEKARYNARIGGFTNVEFRLGEIEKLPVEDGSTDCIISNCVINLAEDKQKVFDESLRILKPQGRLMVSDMVLLRPLPEKIKKSAELYAGCIAGALLKDDYIDAIRRAGFKEVAVIREDAVRISDYLGSDKIISEIAAGMSDEEIAEIDKMVVSIKIAAEK